MENNLKSGQSFKWISHLRTITKSNKDKETIEMDENKSQESSKSHSIVNLFKKLSLGKEKSKTPIKDDAEKTVLNINGIIKCFPKSIKAEESDTKSKITFKRDNSNKISNDPIDAINSSWIDWGDIKSDSVIKYSNYLKTTICKNKAKSTENCKLENSNQDICFETKNIKVEGNDLDVKSKSNYDSDRDESSGIDTGKVCKSKVGRNDNQNSSDDEVIERGPQKVILNKGAHRLNPIQRNDNLGNQEVQNGMITSTMKQLMTSSFSTINSPESYVSSWSKDNFWDCAEPLKQSSRKKATQAGLLCTPNTENNNPRIISEDEVNKMLDRLAEYYIQQDSGQMSSSKLSTVDSKVSETIEKYIQVENIKYRLKLESLAFIQKRNALMGDINLEKQKLIEIEEQIKIQNIKKMLELESLPYASKSQVILKENNKEAAKDHSEVFQDAFKSLPLENFTPVPYQSSYSNSTMKSNNKLSRLNIGIPESNHSFSLHNCSSSESNFNFSERIYSSPESNNSPGSNCSSQCNYNSSVSNHSSPQHNYNSPEYNYNSSPQQNFNFPDCNNSSSQHHYYHPAYNYSSSPECNNSYPQPNYNFIECNNNSPQQNYNFPDSNYSSSPDCSNSSPDSIAENESAEEFMAEMQNYVNYHFKFESPQKSKQPEQGKIWSALNNDYFKGITPKDQKTSCSDKTKARNMLVNSAVFSKQKCLDECLKIYKEIRDGKLGTEDKEVIHYLNPKGKNKYIRTNLHAAVMEGNLEKVFCIVEIHKQCHDNLSFSINMNDKNDSRNRTALDRAQEKENSEANNLLIEYMKENYAKNSLSKVRPNSSRKKHN